MINPRLSYIDITKGIAILALILSHTAPGEQINTWIFGFHMPIFFIIGGILMHHKESKNPITMKSIGQMLQRRFRNLLIPYLVFCLLLTSFYGLLSAVVGQGFNISHNLWRTITFQGVDSLWFIPCYFLSELLCSFLLLSRREAVLPILFLALLPGIISMSIVNDGMSSFVLYWMKISISLSFFICGVLIAKFQLLSYLNKAISVILLVVTSVITHWSGFSAIGSMQFPHGVLYLFSAVIMSVSIMSIVQHFIDGRNNSLLTLFGKYSIVVLCTNNLFIEICRLLDYRIFGDFLLHQGLLGSLLFFIILTIIEFFTIRIAQGRVGIVFGKK